MAKKRQEIEAPPKKAYIPPDIRALGGTGQLIVNAIYRDHSRRMGGDQHTPGMARTRGEALQGCRHSARKKSSN